MYDIYAGFQFLILGIEVVDAGKNIYGFSKSETKPEDVKKYLLEKSRLLKSTWRTLRHCWSYEQLQKLSPITVNDIEVFTELQLVMLAIIPKIYRKREII